jgi:hypothetical protein
MVCFAATLSTEKFFRNLGIFRNEMNFPREIGLAGGALAGHSPDDEIFRSAF